MEKTVREKQKRASRKEMDESMSEESSEEDVSEEETEKEREEKEVQARQEDTELDKMYTELTETSLEHGVLKQKNMFVYVHCNSKLENGQKHGVYKICIGRGKQSFRWLGMAAAQRYGREITSAFGRLRQREADAPRMLIAHVPTSFHGQHEHDHPPNPRMKLRDVLVHGAHVYFEFDHSETLVPTKVFNPRVEFDEDADEPPWPSEMRYGMLPPQGALERRSSEWFQNCYQLHPSRQRRMRKAHRDLKPVAKKKKKKEKKRRPKIKSTHWENVFLNRHEQSEKERIARCTYEVKRSKILKEPSLVPKDQREAVLEVLIRHYHHIEEIFMFACALDNSVPTNQMTKLEFQHFCEHVNIKDPGDTTLQQDLNYLFIATNVEKDENHQIVRDHHNNANTFLRFEFLEALVRLSVLLFKRNQLGDLNESSKGEEDGERGNYEITVQEKLEYFLDVFVEPVATGLHVETAKFRHALTQQKTLKVYHEHRKRFEKVFSIYAKRQDGDRTSGSNRYDKDRLHSLNLGQFMLFLKEANVVQGGDDEIVGGGCDPDQDVHLLTKRQARLIFAQSMQFSYSRRQPEAEIYYRQTQLQYIEFLEAIARIALHKYGHERDGEAGLPIPEALHKLSIDHIRAQVVDSTHKKRSKKPVETPKPVDFDVGLESALSALKSDLTDIHEHKVGSGDEQGKK